MSLQQSLFAEIKVPVEMQELINQDWSLHNADCENDQAKRDLFY